jgi:hypoxanthine phosphoribosyltransferase
MNLFNVGDYLLHSGQRDFFKIDCDALTDSDTSSIAYLISSKVKFSNVTGIPRGGMRLQYALEPYETKNYEDPWLIIDDVLSTGGSMETHRRNIMSIGSNVIGIVVFARGQCPDWITPIFQMHEFGF